MRTILYAKVEITEKGWTAPLTITTTRTFYFDSAAARDDFVDVAVADGHRVIGYGIEHTLELNEAVKEMRAAAAQGG